MRERHNRILAQYNASVSRVELLENKINTNDAEIITLDKVNEFFQQVIDFKTSSTREFIKNLVNDGLSFIFNNDLQIDIVSSIKMNKVVYSIQIINTADGSIGTKESYGGGVLAVISFLLKLTMHFLSNQYKLMVLDETLAFVSEDYQENLSMFLKQISEKFGYDILLISHQPKLNTHANKIYTIVNANGISRIFED